MKTIILQVIQFLHKFGIDARLSETWSNGHHYYTIALVNVVSLED